MVSKGGLDRTTDRQPRARIEVLHVDDDPSLVELTAEFLEREDDDLHVETETDARAALDRVLEASFDCVVSDYQMPTMNGIELLEDVREAYPELPFILFTGKGSEEVASDAISAGVTDYLQKGSGHEEYSVLARQIRNVVERKRAIKRFETFLESAPDSIIIVDTDGSIAQVNEQTEEMFDYDRGALVGEPIERLIPERYREAHVAHRERYMDDPETRPMGADLDLYALKADDTEFPVDISISPIYIGGRVEVMAAVRDISTRKWREAQLREREAELERQNERLEDFASVVSHDLRSPLAVADGSLQLAKETGDLDYLEDVEEAHDRMKTLIDDLLTLAQEGQTVDAPTPVDLDAVAREAWRSVTTANASLKVDPVGATILADRSRLRETLENLFRNAVEHGSTSPSSQAREDANVADGGVVVTVEVTPEGFAVADDGVGIPEAERDRVFESGYSATESGTGFGLAIVRTIAEAHGWDVQVTESAAGGARFEFTGVEFA